MQRTKSIHSRTDTCVREGKTMLQSLGEVVLILGCGVQEKLLNFTGNTKERCKTYHIGCSSFQMIFQVKFN